MSSVNSLINLYDTEIIKIEGVIAKLNASQGRRRDAEGFVQEVIGRFGEIGIKVEVIAFEDENEPGFLGFEIQIVDRIDPEPFDHERMRYEVQHDVLGLEQPGAITADGTWIEPSKSTSFSQSGSGLWTPGKS